MDNNIVTETAPQQPQEIHYRSDFAAILPMADSMGKDMGFPDFDFTVRLTAGGRVFRASCTGGEMVNLDNCGGKVRVIANSHGLQPGPVYAEVIAEIPDPIFPDGHRRTVWGGSIGIKLLPHGGQGITSAQATLTLPLLKGDKGEPFTYADLTPADKTDLIAPIKTDIDKAITAKQDKLVVSDDFLLDSGSHLSLADKAKQKVFDDMWRTAVGKFGTVDHTHTEADGRKTPYMCNDLWMTYSEAIPILQGYRNGLFGSHFGMRVKTIIPQYTDSPTSLGTSFRGTGVINLRFSTQNVATVYANSMTELLFSGHPGDKAPLRKLLDVIQLFGSGNGSLEKPITCFRWCPSLEYFRLVNLNNTLYLNHSSKIGIDSLQHAVRNRYTGTDSKAFAIIVHPDVYAKLTDPDNTEWHTLLQTAAEKLISFATD